MKAAERYAEAMSVDLRNLLADRCACCGPNDEFTHGICPHCPNGPGSGRADSIKGAEECEWCAGSGVTCSSNDSGAVVLEFDGGTSVRYVGTDDGLRDFVGEVGVECLRSAPFVLPVKFTTTEGAGPEAYTVVHLGSPIQEAQ